MLSVPLCQVTSLSSNRGYCLQSFGLLFVIVLRKKDGESRRCPLDKMDQEHKTERSAPWGLTDGVEVTPCETQTARNMGK